MERVLVAIPEGDMRETFLPEEVKKELEQHFEVVYNEGTAQYTEEEFAELLPEFDAVMTDWYCKSLKEKALQGTDRLKLIVHTGGTVANLLDGYAYEKGLKVLSGNIMYAESVAEGTLAYMMMALRRLPDYLDNVKQGKWRANSDTWEGLFDKTVGIIGLGAIGRCVVQLLQPFRVKIKIYAHYDIEKEFLEKYHCETAGLEEIFATCDIVSLHSALNDQTTGMIRKEHFAAMKDGALFVNTARGPIIEEESMVEELRKKRIRAVLDVFVEEPLPVDHELRHMENVYVIPHMAGPTLDRREYITKALIDAAEGFFAGETGSAFEITRETAGRMTKM